MTAAAMDYSDSRQHGGVTVLILEDNADVRESLKLLLELRGSRVVTAGTVREALVLLERVHPDVIVSDIGLPDESGLSFIRKVRSLPAASGGDVPAVALSAYPDSLNDCLAAGFQAGLQKPADPAFLMELIDSLTYGGSLAQGALSRGESARYSGPFRLQSPWHPRH